MCSVGTDGVVGVWVYACVYDYLCIIYTCTVYMCVIMYVQMCTCVHTYVDVVIS